MSERTTVESAKDLKLTFYAHFQSRASIIEKEIAAVPPSEQKKLPHTSADSSCTPEPGNGRAIAINDCLAAISKLNTEVIDAGAYVPAYDVAGYARRVKALSESLESKRREGRGAGGGSEGGASRSGGFKFKSKIVKSPASLVTKEEEAGRSGDSRNAAAESQGSNGPQRPKDGQGHGLLLEDKKDAYVLLPKTAADAGSAIVSNVTRCVVLLNSQTTSTQGTTNNELSQPLATLTLKGITDSIVITGAIAGPIHITDMKNSLLVTACRQFRMHASHRTDVYLQCSSRPIIEECSDIRFAPAQESWVSARDKAIDCMTRSV